MITTRPPKSRRLNVILSDPLLACLSSTAKSKGITVSEFVRRAVENECAQAQEASLAQAAASIAPLYESNPELTAFTALDREDFA
jgi:hypothetical protein